MKKYSKLLIISLVLLSILSLTSCSTNKEKEVEGEISTDYIGDNSKVVDIASNLPYPEGISYDSVEIQSDNQPYELKVFLKTEEEASVDVDMEESAREAFDKIGNMRIISFYNKKNNDLIGSFERN